MSEELRETPTPAPQPLEVVEEKVEVISDQPQTVEPIVAAIAFKNIILAVGLVAFLVAAYFGWRNWRLRQQVESTKVNLSQSPTSPTPSFTATPSSSPLANSGQLAETISGTTTKGGVVLGETIQPTPTPTTTPTPTPTPTKTTAPTPTPTPAPSFSLTKVYLDAQFPYQIRFNDSWIFQRTHGTGTNTSGDILSRVELFKTSKDNPAAIVAAEVLSSKGESNLESWLKNNDTSVNFAQGEKYEFRGQPAVKFTWKDGNKASQKLYFLKGAYAYRLTAWEYDQLSSETLAIRDSFRAN